MFYYEHFPKTSLNDNSILTSMSVIAPSLFFNNLYFPESDSLIFYFNWRASPPYLQDWLIWGEKATASITSFNSLPQTVANPWEKQNGGGRLWQKFLFPTKDSHSASHHICSSAMEFWPPPIKKSTWSWTLADLWLPKPVEHTKSEFSLILGSTLNWSGNICFLPLGTFILETLLSRIHVRDPTTWRDHI